jgi:hypothetical protein
MYVHITYIIACFHQGLNPKLHEDALQSSPLNHFKTLIKEKENLSLLSSTLNYF